MDHVSKLLFLSMVSNFLLSILKIFFGMFTLSRSLIADGIHSFSDLSTDIIAIVGYRLSKKKASCHHPYGYGKLEYVTGIFIAFGILFVGIVLIVTSFQDSTLVPDLVVFYFVMFSVIQKTIVASYLLKKGKQYHDEILISSGKESFTNVYSSILVLIVFACAPLCDRIPFFAYLDQIGGFLVGCMILFTGFHLLKTNILQVTDEVEKRDAILFDIEQFLMFHYENIRLQQMRLIKFGSYYKGEFVFLFSEEFSLSFVYDSIREIKQVLYQKFPKLRYIMIEFDIQKEVDVLCQRNQKLLQ